MNIAADARSGELIDAEAAHSGVRYLCPCCGGLVHLRAGSERVRHFAHIAGEGTPECENFHPNIQSTGSGSQYRLDGEKRWTERPQWLPQVSTPELYLSIVPGPRKSSQWRLDLLVPRTRQSALVDVNDSSRGRVKMDCASLPAGGRRVEVAPKTEPYRLQVANDTDPVTRQILETPILGLHENYNLFQWSDTSGRRLPRNQALSWGERYRLLVKDTAPFPWPQGIEHAEVGARAHWVCIDIRLPNSPDNLISHWVTEQLGRNIRTEHAQVTLVSPTPFSVDDDGSLVIESGQEIILAMHGLVGSSYPGDLFVLLETGGGFVFPCKGPLPFYISLEVNEPGRVDLGFTHAPSAGLHFRAVESISIPGLPSVVLVSRSPDGSSAQTIGLHSRRAGALLEAVRWGQALFTDILVPPGAWGRLSWRRSNVSGEIDIGDRRASASERRRVDPDALGHLSRALRDPSADVVIDFNGFGRASISGVANDRLAVSAFNCSPQLRWLEAIASGPGRHAGRATLPADGLDSDGPVNIRFKRMVQQGRFPRGLEPQFRALVSERTRPARRESHR